MPICHYLLPIMSICSLPAASQQRPLSALSPSSDLRLWGFNSFNKLLVFSCNNNRVVERKENRGLINLTKVNITERCVRHGNPTVRPSDCPGIHFYLNKVVNVPRTSVSFFLKMSAAYRCARRPRRSSTWSWMSLAGRSSRSSRGDLFN